jgi:hypothetical protein
MCGMWWAIRVKGGLIEVACDGPCMVRGRGYIVAKQGGMSWAGWNDRWSIRLVCCGRMESYVVVCYRGRWANRVVRDGLLEWYEVA